jgi:hypothetical protein
MKLQDFLPMIEVWSLYNPFPTRIEYFTIIDESELICKPDHFTISFRGHDVALFWENASILRRPWGFSCCSDTAPPITGVDTTYTPEYGWKMVRKGYKV